MRFPRPLSVPVLVVLLCGVAATTHSQPAPAGGVNLLHWGEGSPAPVDGGVDVTVLQKPTTGYTCTELTIRVIDDATGRTLAEESYANPGETTRKQCAGLGNGVRVRVTAQATFQNGDDLFDFKDLEETVTTRGLNGADGADGRHFADLGPVNLNTGAP